MEFIIKCYPGFEPELARYVPLMERIAVLVSNRGLLILDHAWRSWAFENGASFLPGGAFPAPIASNLSSRTTCARPDAAALSCSNCGCQHRAEECPSFTLSFKQRNGNWNEQHRAYAKS